MAWLFKAAAGHYGMSRDHWAVRQKWARRTSNGCSLLQLTRWASLNCGVMRQTRGSSCKCAAPCRRCWTQARTGVPIRLDQTTSGCGILSTLVRDAKVARMCNVIGKTPRDLYSHIAERVCMRLGHDLQLGDDKQKALAEVWLRRGIDRKLVKGPVLAAPYGGSYMSLCDGLVDALDMHLATSRSTSTPCR